MMRSLFEQPALSVGELCRKIRAALRGQFPTGVRVYGEISRSRTIDGTAYFTLKDREALIECVCFRDAAARLGVKLPLAEGTAVEVTGIVGIYEPKSVYQLRVTDVTPVGKGALHLAFEQLKDKLAREGLFDASRKRAIPRFIRDVAIVTSRSGAVLQDFLTTSRRRGAHIGIRLVHSAVNGAAAAPELAKAIGFAGRLPVDVIVVARGGGSTEDLWAFNTEQVARAIAASVKPVISAIGHETDYTIADFVADLRVATPTAAAEFVAQERDALLVRIASAQSRLRRSLLRAIEAPGSALERALRDLRRACMDAVAAKAQRALDLALHLRRTDPRRRMLAWGTRAREAALRLRVLGPRMLGHGVAELSRLDAAMLQALAASNAQRAAWLEVAGARLAALGPRRTLERGYAIAYDASGVVLLDSRAVRLGEKITVELKSGSLEAQVSQKKDDHGEDGGQEDAGA